MRSDRVWRAGAARAALPTRTGWSWGTTPSTLPALDTTAARVSLPPVTQPSSSRAAIARIAPSGGRADHRCSPPGNVRTDRVSPSAIATEPSLPNAHVTASPLHSCSRAALQIVTLSCLTPCRHSWCSAATKRWSAETRNRRTNPVAAITRGGPPGPRISTACSVPISSSSPSHATADGRDASGATDQRSVAPSPVTDHARTTPSGLALASIEPSPAHATPCTACKWPFNSATHVPSRVQMRTPMSSLPVANRSPSGRNATHRTLPKCASSATSSDSAPYRRALRALPATTKQRPSGDSSTALTAFVQPRIPVLSVDCRPRWYPENLIRSAVCPARSPHGSRGW